MNFCRIKINIAMNNKLVDFIIAYNIKIVVEIYNQYYAKIDLNS